MTEKIGVIGAGAWGTALAMLLADNGHDVILWMYEKDLAVETARTRENRVYLPGFTLPPSLAVTSSLEEAVKGRPMILSVVPSHTVRTVTRQYASLLTRDAIIISASKGIEIDTLMPLSEVFKDVLPQTHHGRLAFLSGPSFAKEVARKLPTAVALASYDPAVGKRAQEALSCSYFRVYTNPDVMGVELAGALKNVVAIAAGVLEGLGFGYNTMAALLTRGLAEMARLGVAMGGSSDDLLGPCRHGRPGPHLHRRPVSEPHARDQDRQGREARRHRQGRNNRCRGSQDRFGREGPGAEVLHRDAHR